MSSLLSQNNNYETSDKPIKSSNKINPIEKIEKSHFERLNIQDDDDGHLIYVPGDVLKNRCNLNI